MPPDLCIEHGVFHALLHPFAPGLSAGSGQVFKHAGYVVPLCFETFISLSPVILIAYSPLSGDNLGEFLQRSLGIRLEAIIG